MVHPVNPFSLLAGEIERGKDEDLRAYREYGEVEDAVSRRVAAVGRLNGFTG